VFSCRWYIAVGRYHEKCRLALRVMKSVGPTKIVRKSVDFLPYPVTYPVCG
jgi:hypothetical protein